MFKKILLPLDLTDKHKLAVDTAGELARLAGGEVILLHVIETIPGLPMEEEKAFFSRLERSAREHLTRMVADLRALQVSCRYEVIFGHRAADTVRYAAEHSIDLIVLTSPPFQTQHPASGLSSLGWKIGVVAACPVLLVKNQ